MFVDADALWRLVDQNFSVEEIAKRFDNDPSTVSYWMAQHGIQAPNPEKYLAKGGIDQDELEAFVQDGMTISEIAEAVGLSKTSVRHWLARYGLRTKRSRDRDIWRTPRRRAG